MSVKLKTIKSAVTVLFEGEYRAPGFPITMPEGEANALIERHGAFDDNPANGATGRAKEADDDSIRALNTFHTTYN